jgi:hypothetical protein
MNDLVAGFCCDAPFVVQFFYQQLSGPNLSGSLSRIP